MGFYGKYRGMVESINHLCRRVTLLPKFAFSDSGRRFDATDLRLKSGLVRKWFCKKKFRLEPHQNQNLFGCYDGGRFWRVFIET